MKEECEHKRIEDAVRVGRAKWLCPDCNADISLVYFLYMQAVLKEEGNYPLI